MGAAPRAGETTLVGVLSALLPGSPSMAWRGTVLVRLLVGGVFLAEGVQKFAYPDLRGPGRFEGMGFPAPTETAYFVGFFEVVCGALILAGFLTRLAAVPTLIIMVVAIVSTKIPVLLGQEIWIFALRDREVYGFLSFMHESRNDFAMLIGSIYLILAGGGPWSVDEKLAGEGDRRSPAEVEAG